MKKIVNYVTSDPMPTMAKFDLTQYEWYRQEIGEDLAGRFRFSRDNMDETELWVLLKDFTLTIMFSDGTFDTLRYKKGFVWDLASVPQALRSLIDNDSFSVFIAALFHDASFGLHLYDFETCNAYFQQLIYVTMEQYGNRLMVDTLLIAGNMPFGKRRKYVRKRKKFIHELIEDAKRNSHLYKFGVDTPIGKKIYNSSIPEIHWNSGLCTRSCE